MGRFEELMGDGVPVTVTRCLAEMGIAWEIGLIAIVTSGFTPQIGIGTSHRGTTTEVP